MLELNFTPIPMVTTERLVLREITLEDQDALFALRSDERVMRYIGKPRASSVQDAVDLIERVRREQAENSSISWAITKKGDPRLIGTVGYYRLQKEHHRGELGFSLSPDHWRQGMMSEAIEACVEQAFERFGFHGIEAITDPENIPSNELLRSCGFVREGLLKESYLWNGHFHDSAIWCKLASKK